MTVGLERISHLRQVHAPSSNSARSTIQSFGFRIYRRIDGNPRACARFAITHGPGERLRRRSSEGSGETYPGAKISRSIGEAGGIGTI
jgi:hypothetical protein